MLVFGGTRKSKHSWEDLAQSMGNLGEKSPKNREGCGQLWRMKRAGPGAGCPLGLEEGTLKMTLLFLER